MAKKQTRRSISVSRTTYERLKAFCETNNISMSQLVETRVNDFLGDSPGTTTIQPSMPSPRPVSPAPTRPTSTGGIPSTQSIAPTKVDTTSGYGTTTTATSTAAAARPSSPSVPMTSAAARFAVDPPPPIIKPKQETAAPKPAEKRPDQIFTF